MSKVRNIFKLHKWVVYLSSRGMLKFIPDKTYLKLVYYLKLKERLDFNNVNTFNEKIQWLKLNDRNPSYKKIVDKYEVRKIIKEKIGTEYLIPIYGVWDRFEDINFRELPNKFVIKCTHDSGGIVICENKDTFDIEKARKKINKCMQRNYYWRGREWPYRNIKPRIIIEKYMVDESGSELKDYKIFCFNGEPKLIQVDFNRFSGHKRNLYDLNWNYLSASIERPTDSKTIIKKPNKLEEMLELSRILSKGYPHIRTDFYSIDDKIYFGEMTLYHGSGFEKFYPKSLEEQMGKWLRLNEEN